MWAHYGNNHCGFAVGFHAPSLAKAMNCLMGFVTYSDKPLDYTIMGDNKTIMDDEVFQKSVRWSSEEEFRFLSAGIGIYRDRASKFPAEVIAEVLVGMDTTMPIIDEIKRAVTQHLPGVPMFQVGMQPSSYIFQKIQIM